MSGLGGWNIHLEDRPPQQAVLHHGEVLEDTPVALDGDERRSDPCHGGRQVSLLGHGVETPIHLGFLEAMPLGLYRSSAATVVGQDARSM